MHEATSVVGMNAAIAYTLYTLTISRGSAAAHLKEGVSL